MTSSNWVRICLRVSILAFGVAIFSVLESSYSCFGDIKCLTVCGLHFAQVTLNALVNLLYSLVQLVAGDIAIVRVDRFETMR